MVYNQLTSALLPEIEQLVKVTLLAPWFTNATPPHCRKTCKEQETKTEDQKKKKKSENGKTLFVLRESKGYSTRMGNNSMGYAQLTSLALLPMIEQLVNVAEPLTVERLLTSTTPPFCKNHKGKRNKVDGGESKKTDCGK